MSVLSFWFLFGLQLLLHQQVHRSLRLSLRACCPTSKACLSPTSPPPYRLVYCTCACVCIRETQVGVSSSMCVESQLLLSVWHWQYSRAAYEVLKWASLPCGTFLLQMPTIDLLCLLIFIASQEGTTALPISCIFYSLSFPPWLSFALPHPWTLFLCLIYKSAHASLPPSLALLSLSSSLSPSISLCQMLRPLCLCVVYIWWLTFPSVTAPFSPQYVSSSARLVYFVSCLVVPREENECPDHSFCCCCIYFVFQRQVYSSPAVWWY